MSLYFYVMRKERIESFFNKKDAMIKYHSEDILLKKYKSTPIVHLDKGLSRKCASTSAYYVIDIPEEDFLIVKLLTNEKLMLLPENALEEATDDVYSVSPVFKNIPDSVFREARIVYLDKI